MDCLSNLPHNKSELISQVLIGNAHPYNPLHCHKCLNIPFLFDWIYWNVSKDINVFYIGKRTGDYAFWDPIYIASSEVPFYDERFSTKDHIGKQSQVNMKTNML